MGKGWAKGLTAATDPRVARAAGGHRGLFYRPRASSLSTLSWSSDVAYVVGLIATDGCLVTGRRQIAFVSKDRELCETVVRILRRRNRIRETRTRVGSIAYRVQFGDAALYRWLMSVGLTPRKSLTLRGLAVPDEFLVLLVRGLLDGDGSIINRSYRADTADRTDYFWEYLQTRFTSASRAHLEWLESALSRSLLIKGYLHQNGVTSAGNPMFELRYGKRASLVLLPRLYSDETEPCLSRKRAIWIRYVQAHGV